MQSHFLISVSISAAAATISLAAETVRMRPARGDKSEDNISGGNLPRPPTARSTSGPPSRERLGWTGRGGGRARGRAGRGGAHARCKNQFGFSLTSSFGVTSTSMGGWPLFIPGGSFGQVCDSFQARPGPQPSCSRAGGAAESRCLGGSRRAIGAIAAGRAAGRTRSSSSSACQSL